jgi:hypothetical protein
VFSNPVEVIGILFVTPEGILPPTEVVVSVLVVGSLKFVVSMPGWLSSIELKSFPDRFDSVLKTETKNLHEPAWFSVLLS